MTKKTSGFGLLIDYEYCTGCYACEVACAQEFKRKPQITKGIRLIEIEQQVTSKKAYLTYLPFPTENCNLCVHLTRKGGEPACVKSCMAACMKHGEIDLLAAEMIKKPRMVLFTPC